MKIYSNNNLKNEIKILENGVLKDKSASYGKLHGMHEDFKIEEIYYYGNIEYDTNSNENSQDKIEVIVEDYMEKTYKNISHEI